MHFKHLLLHPLQYHLPSCCPSDILIAYHNSQLHSIYALAKYHFISDIDNVEIINYMLQPTESYTFSLSLGDQLFLVM